MKALNNVLLPILGGLIVAQLIATGFVFLSNLNVHEVALSVEKNGYIALPHGKAADSLLSCQTAFLGGLFYTLSIGAGLTLITWLFWYLWKFVFQRNSFLIAAFFLLWACLLVAINLKGPTLFPTLFCFLVPLATFMTFCKFGCQHYNVDRRVLMIPAVTLCLLIVFWAGQFDQKMIIKIRDHLLLTNPIGQAVTDFYYRYTLHAAQAFKSFNQKTLRTYRLHSKTDGDRAGKINKTLLRFDVVHVPELAQPDVTITIKNTNIILSGEHGDRVSGELIGFLKNPKKLLKAYSKASDHFKSLRQLSFYGLLLGLPILFFLTLYSLLHVAVEHCIVRRLQIRQGIKDIIVALLILCITIGLYWLLRVSDFVPLSEDLIGSALNSNDSVERLAALQKIESQRLELADYPQYRKLLRTASHVERYWLARTLAVSQSPQTYSDLLSMIEDSHPNVRCQVYYALGMRGDKKATEYIKVQLMASDHWYTQWYGYLALKRLGWRQGQ